jgi:vancomycin permeability regulator SanA
MRGGEGRFETGAKDSALKVVLFRDDSLSVKVFSRKRVLVGIAVLAAVLVLLPAAVIVCDGLSDRIAVCDVGIVLGSKVELDGTPSLRLAARLDRAAELYAQGCFPRVIVSGGTGVEGFDEAAVMKQYLVDHGVPRDRIITDSLGVDTLATARNASRIMNDEGLRSALVITQYFHLTRTKLALRRCGVTELASAHARFCEWRDVFSLAREVAGMYYYWFRPVNGFVCLNCVWEETRTPSA